MVTPKKQPASEALDISHIYLDTNILYGLPDHRQVELWVWSLRYTGQLQLQTKLDQTHMIAYLKWKIVTYERRART